ncbi:MAG: DUF4430 domain-containing protein [Bacillota bacterium]|nr:DUF4430 domain-containing protein [Bacillota bacterium]
MNKKTRNLIIALVMLAVLLVEPFWGSIKSAVTGEDAQTGASTEAPQITCTVAVSCQNLWENPDLAEQATLDLLPEDGWMLRETQLTVPEGTTVLETLQWAAEEAGLTVTTSGSPAFVESIGGLATGDGGDVSGWTYTINGETIMESAAVQTVSQDDQVVWSFVCTWE